MKKILLLLVVALMVTANTYAIVTPISEQPQNELDTDDFALPTDEGLYYQVVYTYSMFYDDDFIYQYIDNDIISSAKVEVWGYDLSENPLLIDTYLYNEFVLVGQGLITASTVLPVYELELTTNGNWIEITYYSNETESDSLSTWASNVEDSIYLSSAYYYWSNSSLITEIENAYNRGYTNGINETQQGIYDTGYSDGYDEGFTEGLTDTGQDQYDEGYLQGYADGEATDYGQNWVVTFFGLFDVIFGIELLPGLTIGVLTGIALIPPVVFGVIKWLRG